MFHVDFARRRHDRHSSLAIAIATQKIAHGRSLRKVSSHRLCRNGQDAEEFESGSRYYPRRRITSFKRSVVIASRVGGRYEERLEGQLSIRETLSLYRCKSIP